MTDYSRAIVPSETYADALAALEDVLVDGALVRVAVAFVTDQGVRTLQEILDRRSGVSLEVVARADDATSPTALEMLWKDVGATVSVVIGKNASAYHPKLWLIEKGETLTVLSGSGNLTAKGLRGNDEQFEIFTVPADSPQAIAHAERFDRLTANALPLDAIHGRATWREWLEVIRRQASHRREIERLGRQLAGRDPQADRTADKAILTADLEDLYRRTREAALQKEDGDTYNPSRFGQAIARARAGEGDPVRIVTTICRRRSLGFDILLDNRRRDLTVEELVLDTSKPYHDLFGEQTRVLCADRLRVFDEVGDGPVVHTTQIVTDADIEAGRIRIPQGRAADAFPETAGAIDLVVRGQAMRCNWNPLHGGDRDRSGRIGIGVSAARTLLRSEETLVITTNGGTIHLD